MRRRNVRRARYSPSTLPHLQKCPGWLGGGSSAAAQRGTDLDACITALISGEFVDVPVEFQDQVEFALDTYEQALTVFGNDKPTICPQHFVKTLLPEVYGTADLVLLGSTHALVLDWKSGFTERGEAGDHLQLRTYATGVASEAPRIETVQLWLVELDKRFVSKSPTYKAQALIDETHKQVSDIIARAMNVTEADYRQNTSCRYCLRSVCCPALEASLKAIEVKDPIEIDDPRKAAEMMSPDRVAHFLRKWKAKVETASALVRQVEARAMAILKAGGDVPGWALGVGRNTRAWADENEAQKALLSACGPGVLETALRSPAQIEKLFKEAKPLVKTLTINKPSEKLIPIEGQLEGE